jgi:predicted aspartyl protease
VSYSRRTFLRQLALLGAGLGAAWWLRDRYLYPTPSVTFAGGQAESGWLKLPGPSGLVELTAHVAGIPIPVVVDSGAQFSAIDRRLAARLGLKQAPIPLIAIGVSGEPSLTHTVGLDLTIGPLEVRGMRAAALELLTLSGVIRRPFAMLIGRDVLRALTLDVDWPNERVRLVRPDAFQPPVDAHAAPTRKTGGALMAPVTIEGAAPVELMVDTGATSEIALSEKTARALGLLTGRRVTTGRSVSLGGVSEDQVLHAETVEFAGHTLQNVEVQVFTPSTSGPIPAGLLGVGILKHYRTAMDLAAGALWLAGPELIRPQHQPGPKSVMTAPG